MKQQVDRHSYIRSQTKADTQITNSHCDDDIWLLCGNLLWQVTVSVNLFASHHSNLTSHNLFYLNST